MEKNLDKSVKPQNLYLWEVETIYKSGRKKTDIIGGYATEKEMWEEYDKHHNKELIKDSILHDAWLA